MTLASIPSIPIGEADKEEEIMDGRNEDRRMVVSGVVVPNDFYVPAFADDVAAVAFGTNIKDLRESIQWALDKIQAWMAEAGLELSPTKSVAVLFPKGKQADISFPGKLRARRLSTVTRPGTSACSSTGSSTSERTSI